MYGRLRTGVLAFVLRVLLWGAVLFPAWYFGAAPISYAVSALAARTVEAVGPVGRVARTMPQREVVFNVEPAAEYVLRERLRANVSIDVPINPLKHTFGMPFFLALLAASRPKGLAWKAATGVAIIGVLAALGMACDVLVQLFPVTAPKGLPLFPFAGAAREAIAIGYQLGVLIFPTVVPIVAWAAMDPVAALWLAGGNETPPPAV
jgi:hypothetical protein